MHNIQPETSVRKRVELCGISVTDVCLLIITRAPGKH